MAAHWNGAPRGRQLHIHYSHPGNVTLTEIGEWRVKVRRKGKSTHHARPDRLCNGKTSHQAASPDLIDTGSVHSDNYLHIKA